MFETAIFTDVAGHEALDGRGGFNFQAISPGFDGVDQAFAREQMQHDASMPESFAYRSQDGRFYWSRGLALGVTASGRGGNQLTQIAVTGQADDLDPFVPAQVFAAHAWDLTKRSTGQSEQWPAPVEIDEEFETTKLIEWVLEDDKRCAFLAHLLTALDDRLTGRSHERIVLVHEDLATAVRWYAAACLLAHPQAVRTLSFRGLVDAPLIGSDDVTACPPTAIAHGLPGAVVCDLTTLTGGAPTVSHAANRCLQLLRDHELFEALEAIDAARRWEPVLGSQDAFWAADLVGGRLTEATGDQDGARILETVNRLAAGGFGQDLEQYQDELAEGLRRADASTPGAIMSLAASARNTLAQGNDVLGEILLGASLRELPLQVDLIESWTRELLTSGGFRWPATHRLRWAEQLTDVAEKAPVPALPGLFALAADLRDDLDGPAWDMLAARYADHIRARPRDAAQTRGLWIGPAIRRRVREHVLRELDAAAEHSSAPLGRESAFAAARQGDWRVLAEVSAGDGDASATELARRLDMIEATRGDIRSRMRSIQSGGRYRAADWQTALAHSSPRDDSELWEAWIDRHGTTPDLVDHVVAAIEADLQDPPTKALKVWRGLVSRLQETERGSRTAGLSARLEERIDEVDTFGKRAARLFGGRKDEQP